MTTYVYSAGTADVNITIIGGSSFSASVYWLTSPGGTAVNLTNKEITWTVDLDDSGAMSKRTTTTDAAAGKIDLTLTTFEVSQLGGAADTNFGTHKIVARDTVTGIYYRLAVGSVTYVGPIGGGVVPPEVEGGTTASSILNVKDFGAVGNGVADDTAAIQAAINACLGGPPEAAVSVQRIASGTVYLPPGEYKVSAPLKIYSTHGMKFLGAGINQTFILPWGTLDTVIDINGSYLGTYGDFVIHGHGTYANATIQTVFQIDWNPAVASRSTHNNVIQNIYIRELKCVKGFVFSKTPTYQMDSLTVRRCSVFGGFTPGETTYWQTGFEFGNGVHANIYNHWASSLGIGAYRYGLHFRATNGPMSVRDVDFALNEIDIRVTGSCRLHLDTLNSENSMRFYYEDGFAGYHNNVEICNVRWANAGDYIDVPDDGRVIRFGYGGSKILRNVAFEYNGGLNGLKFHCINSYDMPTVITTTGLMTPVVLNNLFEIDSSFAGTTPLSVVHMNYVQMVSGVVTSYNNLVNEEYVT